MTINLKDVAQAAGVSLATASRVLSGSDYPVSAEARRRVEAVATDLNYIPNAQAQGLLRGNPRAVGVVLGGDVGDPYFSEMIDGLQTIATELQYLVTVVNIRRSIRHELDAFRALRAHRVGIIILASSGLAQAEYAPSMTKALSAAIDAGETVVTIGRHELGVDVASVSVDNVEAGMLLGNHLKQFGHRKAAVLAGNAVTSVIDRIEGLKRSLGEGLIVREVVPTRDGGWGGMEALLADHPALTAVVGTSDQMAIGALAWLREKRIRVPEDISVAGINDIWAARDMTPSLTTVRLPLAEMGASALRLGIAALGGHISHARLPVELVARDSTGRARK